MKNRTAEEARKYISSPDKIDAYIRITNPGVWSLLIAFLAMIIAVIIWFVVGVIPSTLEVKGILFPGDGTVEVKAPYDGEIQDMRVKTGDYVTMYQTLAVIPNQEKIDALGKKQAEGELDEEELSDLQFDYIRDAIIRVEQTGYVVSAEQKGDEVSENDTIVTIAPVDEATNIYQLICYVPADTARRLDEGMAVQACPSHVSREEYGYIHGYVEYVGEYPVTEEEIESIVGSKDYVQNILGKGSRMEVRLSLMADPDAMGTANKAMWSNPVGNDIPLTIGMEFDIKVVLEEQKAYQLLLGL